MADFKISLNLVANDNASAVMRQVSANVRRMAKDTAAAERLGSGSGRSKRNPYGVTTTELSQLAANMERVGQVARRSLAVPITLAADFESAILKVNALSGGTLGVSGDIDRIAKKARELGKATEFTATEAAEGFQILTQAGFGAQQQIDSIGTVLDFATFGQVSMAKSADLLAASMGGFGLEGTDAAIRVGNTMARVAVSTQANVSDVGATFRKTATMAKTFGFSIENVGTAVSVLGKGAIRGGEAGTALKSIFATLAGPKSDNAKAALKKLGIGPKELRAAMDSGDLKNVFQLFADGIAKSGIKGSAREGLLTAIIGKHHINKFEALVQSLEVPPDSLTSWHRLEKAVNNTDVELHSAAEMMRSGVKGNAKALESAMEELGITIGEKLLPTLLPMIKKGIELAGVTAAWADRNATLVKAMARVALTLAILGPVMGTFVRVAQTMAILGKLTGTTAAFAGALGRVKPNATAARTGLAGLGGLAGGAFQAGMAGAVAIIGFTIFKINKLRQTSRDTLAEIREGNAALFEHGKGLTEDLDKDELIAYRDRLKKRVASEQTRVDKAKAEHGFVDEVFGNDVSTAALEGLQDELKQVEGAISRGGVTSANNRAGFAEAQRFMKSLEVINRAGVAASDKAGGKGNKHDSQLRILVKVDEQSKFAGAMIDEMSLDSGMTVEGL